MGDDFVVQVSRMQQWDPCGTGTGLSPCWEVTVQPAGGCRVGARAVSPCRSTEQPVTHLARSVWDPSVALTSFAVMDDQLGGDSALEEVPVSKKHRFN